MAQADPVLDVAVLEPAARLARVVVAELDEGRQPGREAQDHLVERRAAEDGPGGGEIAREVEVGRRAERRLAEPRLGDPVEAKRPEIPVEVAVAHDVPGAVAVEEPVGVEAAPLPAVAGERRVEDLHPPVALRAPLQSLEHVVGHRSAALGAGERQGLGGLGAGASHRVELGPERAQAPVVSSTVIHWLNGSFSQLWSLIITALDQLEPSLVDLATRVRRLPVAGRKTNTSPEALVLTSQPMAVPQVSEPEIRRAEPRPEEVRRATYWGVPLCQHR